MELLVSELPRLCLSCKMTRKPFYKYVTEGKQSYIIYQCRICNMHDIEPTITALTKRVKNEKDMIS